MYKKSTFLLLLVAALLTACKDKKEEDCVAPAIGQNITGTWQVEMDLGPLGKDGGFTAQFKSNGELVDQDDIFYIGMVLDSQGPVTRHWRVENGRVLVSDTKAGTPTFEFDVMENSCQRIVLDDGGFILLTLTDRQ